MKRFVFGCLVIFLTGLATQPLSATLARHVTLSEMTEQADMIVTGRCESVESRWISRELVTQVTIRVDETLKGEVQKTITVVLPGGVDTRGKIPLARMVQGTPTFRPGDESFLFLKAIPNWQGPGFTILGFSQGKFSIVTDDEGVRRVHQDLSHLLLAGDSGSSPGRMTESRYESFAKRVRENLRSAKSLSADTVSESVNTAPVKRPELLEGSKPR